MADKPGGAPNTELSADFLDFIEAMNAQQVEYVLVGGYAVGYHGVVRATSDIDFLYRRSPDNVARLCKALEEFGAPPVVINAEDLLAPDMVSAFGAPPNRIDLLSEISGVSFDAIVAGAPTLNISGEPLRVIGLAELRANKRATGRKKDRDDLKLLPMPTSDPASQSASTDQERAAGHGRSPASSRQKRGRGAT